MPLSPPPPQAQDPIKLHWRDKVNAYEQIMRLDKPIGIFLLLWPTLMALWVANYRRPDAFVVLLFVVGTVLMRSAGCVINDWWDRHYDGQVKRTQYRPLVQGLISPNEALILAGVLLLLAFLIVLKFNDPMVFGLSAISVVITFIYPLMKRWVHAPQAVLGIAFSMGIPMAFAVSIPNFPPIMGWLVALNILYVIAYDTSYAMADRADDLRLGLKSTAIWLGRADVATIMLLYTVYGVGMIALLIYYGWHSWLFWQCFGLLLFLVDQWLLLRDRDPIQCFKAFRRSHLLAMIFWFAMFKWPPIRLSGI